MVVDKESRATIPFKLNNVQNKYYDAMTSRDIILKARQQGFSTLILALWFIACISVKNTSAVVISHEKEATKRLFSRVRFFIDNMKVKPALQKESETELYFPKMNSRYYIGTAGSRAFGHGDTITILHASEYSRWKNPELMTGLLEAVPQSGRVVVETTANGYGDQFHQMWERAHNPGGWEPHFYGWPELDSNRRVPEKGWRMDSHEKAYSGRYVLDRDQMNWRQWKIGSMERPDLFPQQHPITEEEAFIMPGKGIFEPTILKKYYEADYEYQRGYLEEVENKIRFVEDPNGYLKVYIKPDRLMQYAMGADVMEGIEIEGIGAEEVDNLSRRHDWNVLVVKDRMDWCQCCVYRSQEMPDVLAEKAAMIGRWYRNAIICPENNVGATFIYCLQRNEKYSNLWKNQEYDENISKPHAKVGFRTTSKSKKTLIDLQAKALRDVDAELYDRTTIREHLAFMRTPDGKMEAPTGMNDDCVIADALATMVCLHRMYIPKAKETTAQRIMREEQTKNYNDWTGEEE